MGHLLITALAAKHLFAGATLLLPMLPLSLVLALERWVLSKHVFSRAGLVVFRVAYLVSVFCAVYAAFVLGMIIWK